MLYGEGGAKIRGRHAGTVLVQRLEGGQRSTEISNLSDNNDKHNNNSHITGVWMGMWSKKLIGSITKSAW